MSERAATKVYDPRAEKLLYEALRGRARGQTALVKVTKADAVALTGMPSEQAEPALKSMVKTYRSHLAVTDDGDLVYEFDPTLERRDAIPLRERLERFGSTVWRGFTWVFKIWIVATMIAYVVAFIAMMIALMTARQGSDRNDRRGGDGFGLPWIWYWMMPDLAPVPRDYYGRPIKRQGPPPKRFYQSVFDFVFGPKTAPIDPRAVEKSLIAFLRDHKGRVTATELVALTGWPLETAEEELTRLMAEYDGEVEIADDGTLIYTFEELLKTAGAQGESWRFTWDEREPDTKMTGNTKGANAAIIGFTAFNLIASLTVGPAFLAKFHLLGDSVAQFFVMLFPLLFSLVFFAIPAGRVLVEKRRARRRSQRRIRRELLREVMRDPSQAIEPASVAKLVAERTGEPLERVRASLEKLLPELDGDADADANGTVVYKFPRLVEERAAAEKARAQARPPQLGAVVFSSEDR